MGVTGYQAILNVLWVWIAIVQASQEETGGFKMLAHLMKTGATAKVTGVVKKTQRTVLVRYVDAEALYDDMYKLWL